MYSGYTSALLVVSVIGVDGQEVRNVTGGVDGRLEPHIIRVHSFPDPTVAPHAIQ
jgi:hypothetical protein